MKLPKPPTLKKPPKPRAKRRTPQKKPIVYDGITWDSQTELFFYHWIEEGVEAGILRLVDRQTKHDLAPKSQWSRPLKKGDGLDFKIRSLCTAKTYTDDFSLDMAWFPALPSLALECVPESAEHGDTLFRIDTKAAKDKTDPQWNRRFSDIQRWLWSACRIYVNRVDPFDVFKATWVPVRVRLAAKGNPGLLAKIRGFKSIKNYLAT